MNSERVQALCPCGFGTPYDACCGLIHDGAPAPTAERLMRSRYAAFAGNNSEYLAYSWHPETLPEEFKSGASPLDETLQWMHLSIESTEKGGPFDDEGWVTFSAVARSPEGRVEQRERSRFVRLEQGRRWVYVDGVSLD